jgi:tetratricopeptide (TPR) repeat protein
MRSSVSAILALLLLCPAHGQGEPPVFKKITVPLLCPTANEQARAAYNEALADQAQGSTAERLYRKAVELDPLYCDAMDNLGQMLRRQGKVNEAVDWYKRSLTVKPDNAVAHQNLAAAYLVIGTTDQALLEYQWLVDHEPDNPEGFYGLATVRLGQGQPRASIPLLERAEKLYLRASSPLVADARFQLGLAYFKLQEVLKAKDYFLLIYDNHEDDPRLNLLLGSCYLDPALDDRAKARIYLLRAERLGLQLPPEVREKLNESRLEMGNRMPF